MGAESDFIGKFRLARIDRGLTQRQAAELVTDMAGEMGMEWKPVQQTIAKIETGAQRLTINQAAVLAASVGIAFP